MEYENLIKLEFTKDEVLTLMAALARLAPHIRNDDAIQEIVLKIIHKLQLHMRKTV